MCICTLKQNKFKGMMTVDLRESGVDWLEICKFSTILKYNTSIIQLCGVINSDPTKPTCVVPNNLYFSRQPRVQHHKAETNNAVHTECVTKNYNVTQVLLWLHTRKRQSCCNVGTWQSLLQVLLGTADLAMCRSKWKASSCSGSHIACDAFHYHAAVYTATVM